MLNLLCVTCERDFTLLEIPIKLFRLRTEVLYNIA
jgi:hypothetical protein